VFLQLNISLLTTDKTEPVVAAIAAAAAAAAVGLDFINSRKEWTMLWLTRRGDEVRQFVAVVADEILSSYSFLILLLDIIVIIIY